MNKGDFSDGGHSTLVQDFTFWPGSLETMLTLESLEEARVHTQQDSGGMDTVAQRNGHAGVDVLPRKPGGLPVPKAMC